MAGKKGFVLLPGAGMSDWVWKNLLPLLDIDAVTVDRRLDVNTYENRMNAKFKDCADYACKKMSGIDEIILVGHSGAGLLAGYLVRNNPSVKHVVFIAANIPKDGTTAIDVFPEDVREKTIQAVKKQIVSDSIPMKALETMFRPLFCNTCTEEDIRYILEQNYFPEPFCAITEKMDWTDFPSIGKTYILLTEDKTLTAGSQEIMAGNLGITDIRRIASDHMVMISHPAELAHELNAIAGLMKR
jgi:hypothetical protein